MGFFDYRCLVSGLSLMPCHAYLVMMEKHGDDYRPISLPIHGAYDRLGAVDGVEEDANTARLLAFAAAEAESGRMEVDWEEVRGSDRFEHIEQVLRVSERSSSQEYDALTRNGVRWVHTMVCDEIWRAFAKPEKYSDRPAAQLMEEIFGAGSTAFEIYGDGAGFEEQLAGMRAFMDFMGEVDVEWSVRDDYGQHYSEELREYIDEARERFADRPDVLKAITAHEEDCQEIFEEDEDD